MESTVSTGDLSVDARRHQIMELLEKHGKVRVNQLSQLFRISEVTIRLDLTELEREGLLERIHGGAVSTNKAYYSLNFDQRIARYKAEKQDIARATAQLIKPNDTVLINSGTTTYYIARELKSVKSLTVVTNSCAVAQELATLPHFHVILLGGNYNAQYQFTYGDTTVRQLQTYKTDKLILSVDGISSEFGLTTHHHQEAEVCRAMLERVNQVIIVADASKIGRDNFATISDMAPVDVLITNRTANKEDLAAIEEQGIRVITV